MVLRGFLTGQSHSAALQSVIPHSSSDLGTCTVWSQHCPLKKSTNLWVQVTPRSNCAPQSPPSHEDNLVCVQPQGQV